MMFARMVLGSATPESNLSLSKELGGRFGFFKSFLPQKGAGVREEES